MFPEDSLQSMIKPSSWWIKNEEKQLCRGALIFSFVPHIDQIPYGITPIGRNVPTEHEKADLQIAPLDINQPIKQTDLPVAAMPLFDKEIWTAHKAKTRPCLVFGLTGCFVDKEFIRGKAKRNTAPTILVAPFYSVGQKGKRSGYKPQFVEKVRHCEYPQFFWDKLPINSAEDDGSILRLDHLQPIGNHYKSHKICNHMLSPDAMMLLDHMLEWLIFGSLPEISILRD